jgi:amidase
MLDVPFRSARQLAADIKRKKIGCLELLDLYLARVAKYDGATIARSLAPDDESYYARATRAAVLSHRDWLAANEARHRMRRAWAEFFTKYDLLLCPVAGTAAFPHDQQGERHDRTLVVNGKRVPVTDHLFWAGYTGVSLLPSSAAPCGFTPGGLPVGVQIVGPQYGDLTCLGFARMLEHEFQAFVPPPGYA